MKWKLPRGCFERKYWGCYFDCGVAASMNNQLTWTPPVRRIQIVNFLYNGNVFECSKEFTQLSCSFHSWDLTPVRIKYFMLTNQCDQWTEHIQRWQRIHLKSIGIFNIYDNTDVLVYINIRFNLTRSKPQDKLLSSFQRCVHRFA